MDTKIAGQKNLPVRQAQECQTGVHIFLFHAWLCCLIAEFFVHKHPHFPWEQWWGFYAVYGFVACVLLVLVAKYILRPIVKRREDYYD
jgi:hypothetical protein